VEKVKVAIVLSGVAPAMTLMSGAMLEFAERNIEFQTISTSGVGALVGLLYVAPGRGTPKEALETLPDLFLSDLMSKVLPINFKVFHKKGPFAEPMQRFGQALPRWTVDPRERAGGKRLYNDLVDLWVTAMTPSTLKGQSKGLMTPLPLVDDLVDFDKLKAFEGEFYLNAFNAATRRLKIFTKDELDAKEYAAGQAMGFLYPPQQFGKDVYTTGATYDPTGLQAIWMHPSKCTRPDVIICLDSMRYAYWREPKNIYDAFQLMLLNPVVTLQRNLYAMYAATEFLYNTHRKEHEERTGTVRAPMPKLYRIPLEEVVRKAEYADLLDWSHGSALKFESAGRRAAAPVAQALEVAVASGDLEPLERFRFRRSDSFARQYGTWHEESGAAGQHHYGLVAGFEEVMESLLQQKPAVRPRPSGRKKAVTRKKTAARRRGRN